MIFKRASTIEQGLVPAARMVLLSALACLTPLTMAAATSQTSYALIDAAFYSGAVIVLFVCLLINGAIKNLPGIYYTVMFMLGLLFVWAIDGGLTAIGIIGPAQTATVWTIALITTGF